MERTWGESSPRPVEYGALGSWRMMRLSGGFSRARCTFSGWVLVCGASFFGLAFGARCAVFGLDFGARCVVAPILGADFGARCALLGSFLVCGAPFLGSILVRGVCGARPFWVRFWCVALLCSILVRRALMLGPILVPRLRFFEFALDFGVGFGARCAFFVGFAFGARYVMRRFWGRFSRTVCLFGLNFNAHRRDWS